MIQSNDFQTSIFNDKSNKIRLDFIIVTESENKIQ